METPEIARFKGSKAVFIRVQVVMAFVGAALITAGLYLAGNPDWWIGIVGSFAGIAMRGYYIADEQLGFEWVLTTTHLVARQSGPSALERSNLCAAYWALFRLSPLMVRSILSSIRRSQSR